MHAVFDKEQPEVYIVQNNNKVYVFICINGSWTIDPETHEKRWECDFNQIVTTSDKIDISDVKQNPNSYIDWEEPKQKSESERIYELEKQNAMLIECILEMSTIIYE